MGEQPLPPKRPKPEGLVYVCPDCGCFVPRHEAFKQGRCQLCHHQTLKNHYQKLRNRFAAGFGLALGLSIALFLEARQMPGGPFQATPCCTIALVWPLSIGGVAGLAALLDRLRGNPDQGL